MRRKEVRRRKAEAKRQIEQSYKEMVKVNKLHKVENVITCEVFNTVEEAAEVNKIKAKQIQKVLDGKRKYAGKNPLNNQHYEWRYCEDNKRVWFNEYAVR